LYIEEKKLTCEINDLLDELKFILPILFFFESSFQFFLKIYGHQINTLYKIAKGIYDQIESGLRLSRVRSMSFRKWIERISTPLDELHKWIERISTPLDELSEVD
jgi:hypothetical protein